MFSFGKRILIHRKRSPFPPLGKVNGIRNFAKKLLIISKPNAFKVRYHQNYDDIKQMIDCDLYLPL